MVPQQMVQHTPMVPQQMVQQPPMVPQHIVQQPPMVPHQTVQQPPMAPQQVVQVQEAQPPPVMRQMVQSPRQIVTVAPRAAPPPVTTHYVQQPVRQRVVHYEPAKAEPATWPDWCLCCNCDFSSWFDGPSSDIKSQRRNRWLMVGCALLLLICFIPIWNAIALLQDPAFRHFCATQVPWIFLLLLAVIGIAYMVSVILIFSHVQNMDTLDESLYILVPIVLTVLGALFLMTSVPLANDSYEVYTQIVYDCAHGSRTRDLYGHSASLQQVRNQPSCLMQSSVEECQGFAYTDANDFLKSMERSYHCSGFCYNTVAAANPPLPNASAMGLNSTVLLQTHSGVTENFTWAAGQMPHDMRMRSMRARSMPELHSMGAQERLLSSSQTSEASAQPTAGASGSSYSTVPPALFSKAIYVTSCSGMAARDMRHFIGDVSQQFFYEGMTLVAAALVITFVKLFHAASKQEYMAGDSEALLPPSPGYGYAPQYGSATMCPYPPVSKLD